MPTSPQADPIHIFYPNGGNEAVQMYVWDGTKPILWTGQVSFSGTISIGTVSGSLSNNTAAPAANNLGALTAVVSTVGLGYTSGRQVLLRVDTTGALVVSATISTTGLALASNQTDGSQKTQVVNTTGNTQDFGAGTTTTATIRVVLPTDQTSIPVTGNVTATVSNATVSGTLTNNNAAPAANNVGVLPAICSTTGLGYTDGRQVLLRTDTTGALVVGNQTDGSQKTQVVNTTGATQAFGAGTTTTTTIRVVLPTDQTSIPVTGTITATVSNATVAGTLTNNNAVPAANNVGVLPAIVSTTALGYTQGNQSLLRVDTTGALVVNATLTTTGLATSAAQTDGSQKTQVVNTTNNTQAFGSGALGTTTVRVVVATDQPLIPGVVIGAANLATGQVTVTTTATVIAATRATRRSVTVVNGGAANIFLGNTTVSTTTGVLLFGTTGAAVTFFITGTLSGIVASGSQSVSFFEEYD